MPARWAGHPGRAAGDEQPAREPAPRSQGGQQERGRASAEAEQEQSSSEDDDDEDDEDGMDAQPAERASTGAAVDASAVPGSAVDASAVQPQQLAAPEVTRQAHTDLGSAGQSWAVEDLGSAGASVAVEDLGSRGPWQQFGAKQQAMQEVGETPETIPGSPMIPQNDEIAAANERVLQNRVRQETQRRLAARKEALEEEKRKLDKERRDANWQESQAAIREAQAKTAEKAHAAEKARREELARIREEQERKRFEQEVQANLAREEAALQAEEERIARARKIQQKRLEDSASEQPRSESDIAVNASGESMYKKYVARRAENADNRQPQEIIGGQSQELSCTDNVHIEEEKILAALESKRMLIMQARGSRGSTEKGYGSSSDSGDREAQTPGSPEEG